MRQSLCHLQKTLQVDNSRIQTQIVAVEGVNSDHFYLCAVYRQHCKLTTAGSNTFYFGQFTAFWSKIHTRQESSSSNNSAEEV